MTGKGEQEFMKLPWINKLRMPPYFVGIFT